MRKKQFRTSVLIDNEPLPPFNDWKFIKERGLKPTNLLRAKIKELRLREEGQPDAKELIKRNQKIAAQLQLTFDVMNNLLSQEQVLQIIKQVQEKQKT